jgi:hypothetical protein
MPRGDGVDDVGILHRITRGPQPGLGGAAVGVDPDAVAIPVTVY